MPALGAGVLDIKVSVCVCVWMLGRMVRESSNIMLGDRGGGYWRGGLAGTEASKLAIQHYNTL